MSRCVLNVATGRYVRGQARLRNSPFLGAPLTCWTDRMPDGCPSHLDVPYAFKAHALRLAAESGFTTLLWADASILPIAPLEPLWEKVERDGAWISNNGWSNYQWTAESAYPELFPGLLPDEARILNRNIPHVVATAFGLNLKHENGLAIYEDYLRLARTRAFCGPWWNSRSPVYGKNSGAVPCGPADVHGHRHDQTALSVLAWKYDVALTDPPEWFAYRGGEREDTVLLADGGF